MYRDHTKVVQIGNKKIGGGNPILIQSMTNTKTEDVEATVRQILELEAAGCDNEYGHHRKSVCSCCRTAL
jgi:(E)-4-hydroxy-3-methylbut-2-enyl-diphosphate synthase